MLTLQRSTDVNECKNRNVCGNGAKCVNNNGGYECQCKPGFHKLDGDNPRAKCKDINECELSIYPCGANSICQNAEGHFKCLCKDGFIGNATLGCKCM